MKTQRSLVSWMAPAVEFAKGLPPKQGEAPS